MTTLSCKQDFVFWCSRFNYQQIGIPIDARQLGPHFQPAVRPGRVLILIDRIEQPLKPRVYDKYGWAQGKRLECEDYRGRLFTDRRLHRHLTFLYLRCVDERVPIDDQVITLTGLFILNGQFESIVRRIEAEEQHSLTLFEIASALAVLRCSISQMDTALIDVRVRSRLESMYVKSGLVTFITNPSFDRMTLFGESLPEAIWKKAGILKPSRLAINRSSPRKLARVMSLPESISNSEF